MDTFKNLPLSFQMNILSLLDQDTQSKIFADTTHERLPPVKFPITTSIPPAHVLQPDDLSKLETDGFVIKDSFLGQDNLQKFLASAKRLYESGKLKPAGMGKGTEHWVDTKARSDNILWLNSIDQSEDEDVIILRDLVNSIKTIQTQLNEDCSFESQETQIQLTCYPGAGSRYIRHLDAFVGSSTRRITCLYYMNPNWKKEDGGELRIFNPKDGETLADVEPLGDRLLIFQSRLLEHEVLPSHSGRYALTVWFY